MIFTVTTGLSLPLAPSGSLSSTRAKKVSTSPGSRPYSASGRGICSSRRCGAFCGNFTAPGSGRERFRLRNSSSREMPQSSSAESKTGSTAVGVASDCCGGRRIRTIGYWSFTSVTLLENDCCDGWPASSMTRNSNFPSATISNWPTASWLPASVGCMPALSVFWLAPCPRVISNSPPESGRLLVAQTVTLVPRRPLTPSFEHGIFLVRLVGIRRRHDQHADGLDPRHGDDVDGIADTTGTIAADEILRRLGQLGEHGPPRAARFREHRQAGLFAVAVLQYEFQVIGHSAGDRSADLQVLAVKHAGAVGHYGEPQGAVGRHVGRRIPETIPLGLDQIRHEQGHKPDGSGQSG